MAKPLPRWFGALLWATMLLFAAMVWTSMQALTPAPEWSVFDARVLGYDLDYARGYLAALRETDGIDVYLGRQRMLDTVFPALLTAMLLVVFRVRFSGVAQMALGALALIYLGADYLENARVAGLLRTAPDALTKQAVAAASFATIAKYAALVPCLIAAGAVYVQGRIAQSE
ncbi:MULTISPECIES: hypothetical protein [Roseobacteraceae]|uniref:Uncharacterized protein n=1 Tax=Pseudosulfitobacter pseudonitzschiae TaxID=1402135 RepID=A0A221K256_9RHOB|nr:MULTISPECIES: hypothetical protein [Roseobacteraceae]ASM73088.1 hypothetical protein SULPSESMR1_02288 [Pseudosulfitobacter pseudonitzschiae]